MIHVSAQHRVVGVPGTPKIISLFPKAKVTEYGGQTITILPHGLQETIALRNAGFDVPAPILSQYRWTGSKQPYEVQRLTCGLMTTAQRCFNLNGMGTGKTKCALWSFDYLRGLGLAKRMLVSAPLSTLNMVWLAEVMKTTPHLTAGVLHGSRKRRLQVLEQEHDIYIINTDGFKVLYNELMARKDINTLCLDEVSLYRNATAERSKLARSLAKRMAWVWGMTGSPTPTAPTDAWGQCRIVTPHTVPEYFGRFREEVMIKGYTGFDWLPKKDANETVFKAMQPAVRFTLDDVVELPPVIDRYMDVEMGVKQKHVYEEIRKHAYVALEKHEITAVNAGAVYNKLLQVSLGYVYTAARGVVALDNHVRLDALVDAINSTDRKVLVFVPFTHALEGIYERLQKEKIDTALVHGDTSKGARDKIFAAFQGTSKFKVIAAHPGCMSHGLTLTAADTVVWFGPPTSLELFEQANARVRRIGQKHKQQVIMMRSTQAERKTYERLMKKQHVQNNLLEMFAADTPQ